MSKPQKCTCTKVHVATLAETLDCPMRWAEVPGKGWFHLTARGRMVAR